MTSVRQTLVRRRAQAVVFVDNGFLPAGTMMEHGLQTTQTLRAFWQRSLAAPPARSEQAFERVLAGWNEPQRAYHTTEHLLECLRLLEEWHSARPWRWPCSSMMRSMTRHAPTTRR